MLIAGAYAAVDHGYAATIHKSQGVTVDRTHVLATPGMDRDAAYVALSRHRDGVQLHYGHDDFASDARLAAVLSRDRAKDMAADYAAEPDAAVRAFADRRDIRLPERVREIVRAVETKARSMFAGFRPKAPEAEPTSPRESTNRPDQEVAIQRYARATVDAAEMQRKGLPVLPHQMTAMDRAGEALDRVRDQGTRDLVSAFQRDPVLVRDAAAGNTRGAARAMAEEARVRADPGLRAGRFMERWRALEAENGGAGRTAAQAEMIDGLRHDPALRSQLERSAPELGLDRDRQQMAEQTRRIEMYRARDRQQDRGF